MEGFLHQRDTECHLIQKKGRTVRDREEEIFFFFSSLERDTTYTHIYLYTCRYAK